VGFSLRRWIKIAVPPGIGRQQAEAVAALRKHDNT
jgi:hypothetical protein